MFNIGNLIVTYRKWIILFWFVIIICLGNFSFSLPGQLGGDGFEYEGSAKKAAEILKEEFGQAESSIIILFDSRKGTEVKTSAMEEVLDEMAEVEGVERIISPFERPDMINGNLAYALIEFAEKENELEPQIAVLKQIAAQTKKVDVSLTGGPIIVNDLNKASQRDLVKAELIGVPVALIVLIIAFGGLVAAAIPILIGIFTILTTMGIIYFFSQAMTLSVFMLNVIPMIGLALSIDFALLMINRFKEEIELRPLKDAIGNAVYHAGHSIIISSATVAVSMLALLFFEVDIFMNVGLGGMVVVAVAGLVSVTLLPAILALLGKRVNKLPLFKIKRADAQETIWWRMSALVMKRPVMTALVTSIILIIGMIPSKDLQLAIPSAESLPEETESRDALEQFEKTFGKEGTSQVDIIIEHDASALKTTALKEYETIIEQLEDDALVTEVHSLFSATNMDADALAKAVQTQEGKSKLAHALQRFTAGDKSYISVSLNADSESTTARTWVREFYEQQHPMPVLVGGQAKFKQEIYDEVFEKLPYALGTVIGITFLIIMFAFKSIAIPVKAIFMNVLSLGTTFGILVLLFPDVPIALVIPVFMVIAFALSVDYEVFLVSRIHEVYKETADNDYSTLFGLASTSKVITSAGLIMITIFAAFGFTDVMPIKQLGVGLALAIAIDITIVRMLLVPALLKLLGDLNWWYFGYEKRYAAIKENKQKN